MVSVEEVEREILELEHRDTSYAVVERLCWLYVVRDHLRKSEVAEQAAQPAKMTGDLGESDFLVAASMVPLSDLMAVLDEHMEAIKVICPREYQALMAKISSLR